MARLPELAAVSAEVAEQVTYDAKYAGYVARQEVDIARQQRLAEQADSRRVSTSPRSPTCGPKPGRSSPGCGPSSLAQASRISGITPADLALLVVHLGGG